jgi:hypothetical protein
MMRGRSTKQRLIALYGVAASILCAGWALYAAFGHRVIEAAYRGDSIAIVNRLIAGQSEHPVSFYVSLATVAMSAVSLVVVALCVALHTAIVDSAESSPPAARYAIAFLGSAFAVLAFSSATIVFFYPLEIETRESSSWLHVNAQKSGINLYDHTTTAFVDMSHGPLGSLMKFWIASLFPFLAPWQVSRLFVLMIPFVFLFVSWRLTAATSGTSHTPVLFLSSLGFVMLMVTAREFIFVGRSDATITVLLLIALYAALSTAPRSVLTAALYGASSGLLGIAMVLTIWRLAPVTLGVFVFSIWRFLWVERISKRLVGTWAVAYGLTCVVAFGLILHFVFHGDLRLYYGHFFSYFAATSDASGKHYPGSVLAFLLSLFNPTAAPNDYKGGPLLLAGVLYAVTWGMGGTLAEGLKALSVFALVVSSVGYYFAYKGGGSWHFIPFFIIFWAYLCTVQASIPRARLAWVAFCVAGLVGLSAQTVVVPTVQRALRRDEAMAFLKTLQMVDSTHTVVSEDLFFFRTKYQGELIDMGEDTDLVLHSGVIDEAFANTARRHFDRLRNDPPEYIVVGSGASPELEQLIRDRYVIEAKGPGNLTGDGLVSSRLYRRRDVNPGNEPD